MPPTQKSRLPAFLAALFIVVAVGGCGYLYFRDTVAPVISIQAEGINDAEAPYVSPDTPFAVEVRDDLSELRKVEVRLEQDGDSWTVPATVDGSTARARFTLTDGGPGSLQDGPFTLNVLASDASFYDFGAGSTATASRSYILDTRAPRLNVLSYAHNMNQGGSGLIVYTVDEDVASSGVQVGNDFFPGYKMDDGRHAALFAMPYYVDVRDFAPRLLATDRAGNTREQTFAYHANPRDFRGDVINIPDSFLQRKMGQFEDETPGASSDLERFLKVNRDMRVDNRARLKTIAALTTNRPLWDGAFGRLPNSATRALFGDRRVYKYQGQEIDRQTHLGVDLASVRNAPVPASNAGRVVHTGFFGIYGESVIIDHGLGLQTLYAHLSQIDVEEGQMVAKDEIIGKTGATGLAGGDHLHFGVIVSGVPVNPVEWWDGTWITNNVSSKLQ